MHSNLRVREHERGFRYLSLKEAGGWKGKRQSDKLSIAFKLETLNFL